MGNVSIKNDHPMQMAATLITGGSGYIGQNLVQKLSKKKQVIIPLYRRRIPQPEGNIYPINVDLNDRELLLAPLRGVNTVIHLAWIRSIVSPQDPVRPSTNLCILSNLLGAMEKVGTSRIIFVSAIGACKNTDNSFLKEKYEAEHLILNSKVREKVILRSSIVFGGSREGGFVESIRRVMRMPMFYPVPASNAKINPLHIDDLTSVIANCCDVKMYDSSAIVDITGGEAYKISDIFKIVSQHYFQGRKIPIGIALGDFIVNLYERKMEEDSPRLKHYLSFGSLLEKRIRDKNPFAKLLPNKMKTFREDFSTSQKQNL